jgi:hypothetical protein
VLQRRLDEIFDVLKEDDVLAWAIDGEGTREPTSSAGTSKPRRRSRSSPSPAGSQPSGLRLERLASVKKWRWFYTQQYGDDYNWEVTAR